MLKGKWTFSQLRSGLVHFGILIAPEDSRFDEYLKEAVSARSLRRVIPSRLSDATVRWAESLLARGTRLVICDDNVAKFQWHRAEAEGVPRTTARWSGMLHVTLELTDTLMWLWTVRASTWAG